MLPFNENSSPPRLPLIFNTHGITNSVANRYRFFTSRHVALYSSVTEFKKDGPSDHVSDKDRVTIKRNSRCHSDRVAAIDEITVHELCYFPGLDITK